MRLADGTYRFKGEPVPEAASWSAEIRKKRIKQGVIEKIQEVDKPKKKKTKAIKK
jgi:hypothetical protein